MVIQYLNTDLDLVSSDDLTLLVASLKQRGLFVLHCTLGDDGLWHSTLETDMDSETHFQSPEETIGAMLNAIESLDDASRQLWKGCSKRELNIGYDCGDEPWAFNQGLTNHTLARVAAAGASLRITLYPPVRAEAGSIACP